MNDDSNLSSTEATTEDEEIKRVKKLRHLHLGSSPQVQSIEPLGDLRNLITLELENFKKDALKIIKQLGLWLNSFFSVVDCSLHSLLEQGLNIGEDELPKE